jgi:RNA polymerase sigma factor (sigma-70 family)
MRPSASPQGEAGPSDAAWDDPDRFEALFHRHAPRIQRYVVRRLGQHAADDIVAETFLDAFRRRKSYDMSYADALPWLYGIATKLIGRHRRDEVRLYRALARTGADLVTAPFSDRVDERVSAAAAGPRRARVLAELPAAYRDALLLVAWGDLSYEEAATALGVPKGTVRSRLSRARTALRRSLGDNGPSTYTEKS